MFTIWLEASAGSGKTTFLLSKIKETNADKIMFITFSNTAADEIKNRTNSKIYSTTLHALAYKIILNKINKNIASQSLRYQAILKLLENEDFYQLISWMLEENITLDEHIQEQIDRPSLKEENAPNNLNNTEYIWEKELSNSQIIPAYKRQEIKLLFFTKQNEKRKKMPAHMDLKYIEWAIARIIDHENYAKNYALWVQGKVNKLITQEEEKIKEINNVIYYEDLITYAKVLLKKEENAYLLMKYFGNIKVLLIDESQDLSKNQWELLLVILCEWKALGNTLIVASDAKQLIYDFQGASLKSFLKAKEDIKKLSSKFEIKHLNHTFRLPKKICEFVNNVGSKLEIDFVEHSTQSQQDGCVEIMLIDDIYQIVEKIKQLQNQNMAPSIMLLFKQKTERMQNLANALFAHSFVLNSPFSCMHPVIKDFQHLINWMLSDNQFSLHMVLNIIPNIKELMCLKKFKNLTDICIRWIMNQHTQSFLQNKLGESKPYWEDVLLEYAVFYQHKMYEAITDASNFFKAHLEADFAKTNENKKNLFQEGLFFNTIHSAKGMEADVVFLLETDFKSKFKNDTHRLLYVGLTRAKEKLIIPIFRKNLDKLDNTWAKILVNAQ